MTKPVIRAKGARKAEILIYEDIGESGWFGDGITAKSFADELNALGPLDELNVRIQSGGGSVFDGVAIYNTIKRNSARVIVDIDGLAASIASLIAMAGDEIRIAENSFFMIHDPVSGIMGRAEDLRRTADLLDKITDTLVSTYAERSGAQPDKIRSMMSEETWMTAEEAMVMGFADSMTDELPIAACAEIGRYGYKHLPAALRPRAPVARAKNDKVVRMRMRAERLKV